jgi:hypothetical protein
MGNFAMIEFPSAATAGIVYAQIGWVPDYVELITDTGTVNAKSNRWVNNARFAGWPVNQTYVSSGGSTASVVDATTLISPYAGGETITAAETANTAGKHVDRAGAPAAAGTITAPGVRIAAAAQVNAGRNLLLAYSSDR